MARNIEEGPAAWIAAIAAVVIIPVTIVIGIRATSDLTPTPSSAPTPAGGSEQSTDSAGVGRTTATEPAPPTPGSCVRANGSEIACGGVDAWLVVMASPCDVSAATQALGVDPGEVELQIESDEINGSCAVAPTASAKTAGATAGDLAAIRDGTFASGVFTCWTDLTPSAAVPCNQPHRFEPVTAWVPVKFQEEIEATCKTAAGSYVAGPVDVLNGQLTTRWVSTQEQEPTYRCLVASNTVLNGTVYRLSGRPLPVAR